MDKDQAGPTVPARKRMLSGMQPTGTGALHLGNLEGALRSWIRLQDQYEMFCCIVDWHALTTRYDEADRVAAASREVAADYIAGGLDPDKCAIFIQSHVKQHAELHLLLSMITPLGWLERVPSFKEKRELVLERASRNRRPTEAHTEARASEDEHAGDESITYGLLGYPCLQAADILAYRACAVPVGKDQAAHLELTREIARRFNRLYSDVFPEPQAMIDDTTGAVIGIDGRKMSKSYGNAIYLSDSADTVAEKIMSAFTTPTKIRRTDPGEPEQCAVCQLRRIYDPNGYRESWESDRAGTRGCVENKRELIDILNAVLDPIRRRRAEILADAPALERILQDGAARARETAEETLTRVRSAMGLR